MLFVSTIAIIIPLINLDIYSNNMNLFRMLIFPSIAWILLILSMYNLVLQMRHLVIHQS